jgi:hypothetical protein
VFKRLRRNGLQLLVVQHVVVTHESQQSASQHICVTGTLCWRAHVYQCTMCDQQSLSSCSLISSDTSGLQELHSRRRNTAPL